MALLANAEFNNQIARALHDFQGFGTTPNFEIYKGTVPQSGDFTLWASYKSTRTADLLATLSSADVHYNSSVQSDSIYFETNSPTITTGSATGTATWAAWISTSPGNPALIGSVSTESGNGPFILNSTSITTVDNIIVTGFRLVW